MSQACVSLIARYSYPIFLVLRMVVLAVIQKIDVYGFYPLQHYMLLAAECVIIFALSVALEKVSTSSSTSSQGRFKDMSWRPGVRLNAEGCPLRLRVVCNQLACVKAAASATARLLCQRENE